MLTFLSIRTIRAAALPAAAGLVAACLLAGGSAAATRNAFTIQLLDTGPSPQTLTIAIGDSVTFVNAGAENHDVFMPNENYTAPLLRPGSSTSLQMKSVGKFPYTETGFTKAHRGTIVVLAAAPGTIPLTLDAAAGFVVYGGQATLTGKSTMPAGTPLVLLAHLGNRAPKKCATKASATPSAGWAPVGNPSGVGPDGTYSFVVTPTISTTYRVESTDGKVCSPTLTMQVQPVVSLRAASVKTHTGRPVTITGTVKPATAATSLSLMSLVRATGTWRKLATKPTSPSGSARFTFHALHGSTRLRVATSAKGVRGAYLAGTSRSLVVTGVGAAPAASTKHKHRAKKH
jgi:plastocyanin